MKTRTVLNASESAYLIQHFRLAEEIGGRRTIRAIDLLDGKRCENYLDDLAIVLRAPTRMIAASQFAKRYAFFIVSLGLYAVSMFNKSIDVSIGNVLIASSDSDAKWSPTIALLDGGAVEPEEGKRTQWRDEAIGTLFGGHLSPLWNAMSKFAGVPKEILWENTAVRLFSLYEKRLPGEAGAAHSEISQRIRDDYAYLIHGAAGSLFGEKANPLAKYYGSDPAIPTGAAQARIRKTCCFYYRVADGSYCSNCPKAGTAANRN